ncbi:MAG: hypothetical protein HY390_01400 [Deltaproteobacteria bacterium]|nr:hypothetical protein [Deltaproteobacteria bacterium]
MKFKNSFIGFFIFFYAMTAQAQFILSDEAPDDDPWQPVYKIIYDALRDYQSTYRNPISDRDEAGLTYFYRGATSYVALVQGENGLVVAYNQQSGLYDLRFVISQNLFGGGCFKPNRFCYGSDEGFERVES